MSRHHHCHNHDHNPAADKWTNIAAGGKAVSSLISDGYWFASLFDIASGLETNFLGVSYWGLGFGVTMGLLTACGAMYCHRELNTHHQPREDHNHAHAIEARTPQPQSAQVINDHGHASAHYNLNAKLTWLQIAFLVCDGVSHTGDIVGPMTFVVNLATANSLSRLQKGLVQAGLTGIGALCSVADVRSCSDSIKERNARILVPVDEESNLLNSNPSSPSLKRN